MKSIPSAFPSRPGRVRVVAIALALLVVAAACSNDDGGGSTSPTTTGKEKGDAKASSDFNQPEFEGTPADGGSITFGVESNIATLDPAGNLAQPSDIDVALAIYDQLITYDDKGAFAPSLATEWTNTDDLKTWTFTLRTGVTFHDGTPFNADSVVKHFERLKDPATACACAPQVEDITSIEATDDSTVVFTLAEPNAFFMSLLTGAVGYIASPTATEKFGADYPRNPVGTGAFSLPDYDALVLKKNPDYWRKDAKGKQLPHLDEIKVQPIPDARGRYNSLLSGDVDIVQTADTATVVDAVQEGSLKIQKVNGTSAVITIFNLRKPPFDDVRLRLATAHALNRDQLNRVLYKGSRQPALSPFPPESPFYDESIKWPEFNQEKARKLIAEVKADGWDGTYTTTCIATDESRRGLAQTQAMGKAVGAKSTLEFKDQGAYVNEVFSEDPPFQVGCFRSPQSADADGFYEGLHSEGANNVLGYENATVDKALEDIRRTTDAAEHKRLLAIVQKQIVKDVPTFPILFDLFANIHTDKVSGLAVPRPNSLGAIDFANLYLKA
ncbi:MAG: ABC transporter substrate-binding protein [Acidimicrobiales bacterium]